MLKHIFRQLGQKNKELFEDAARLKDYRDDGYDALNQGDYEKAVLSLTSAYELGDTNAAYWLGQLHAHGMGTKKDPELAFEFYSISAINGDMRAMRELGGLYHNGSSVERDLKKAYEFFLSAANLGDSKAQLWVAKMLAKGGGTPKNYAMAFDWYQRAASQKNSAAYFELGKAYESGRGTEADNVLAYMWYNLGAYEEVDGAAVARDRLEEDMDTNEVEEAQRLTTEWLNEAAKSKSDMEDEAGCDIES